jgi:hypothetical protein
VLEDPASKMDRHRRTGVLVDTGLLLVYFVGFYDYATGYQLINESKFTKGNYGPADFEILDLILNEFNIRITTPYILAEVSNLIKLLPAGADTFCRALLKDTIPSLDERYVPANELAEEDAFLVYGVADTSIVKAAEQPCLVLTDDFPLSGYMSAKGMDVLNFHQIKHVVV